MVLSLVVGLLAVALFPWGGYLLLPVAFDLWEVGVDQQPKSLTEQVVESVPA